MKKHHQINSKIIGGVLSKFAKKTQSKKKREVPSLYFFFSENCDIDQKKCMYSMYYEQVPPYCVHGIQVSQAFYEVWDRERRLGSCYQTSPSRNIYFLTYLLQWVGCEHPNNAATAAGSIMHYCKISWLGSQMKKGLKGPRTTIVFRFWILASTGGNQNCYYKGDVNSDEAKKGHWIIT